MNSKLSSLEGHSLKDIRMWNAMDQAISEALGSQMRAGGPLPPDHRNSGFFAAHAVAGAVIEALKTGANIQALFNSMVDYLDTMNQNNSTWTTGLPPAPTPTPVPVPVPPPGPVPSDECACLCQCFQLCKSRSTPLVHTPRHCTNHQWEGAEEVALAE
jgi:hypothetical protein